MTDKTNIPKDQPDPEALDWVRVKREIVRTCQDLPEVSAGLGGRRQFTTQIILTRRLKHDLGIGVQVWIVAPLAAMSLVDMGNRLDRLFAGWLVFGWGSRRLTAIRLANSAGAGVIAALLGAISDGGDATEHLLVVHGPRHRMGIEKIAVYQIKGSDRNVGGQIP